jgi:hypothetical protein
MGLSYRGFSLLELRARWRYTTEGLIYTVKHKFQNFVIITVTYITRCLYV